MESVDDMQWRAIVRKLSPEENAGRHNIFVNTFDSAGQPLRRVIQWGWEGQRSDEVSEPVRTDMDKRPMCDIPIFPGQRIWLRVAQENSEIVTGLNSTDDLAAYGHQSYEATFIYSNGTAQPDPPENQVAKRLRQMASELLKLADEVERNQPMQLYSE